MNPRKWLSILALAAAPVLFAFAALPQKDAWKPLFNGKDLTGWKHVGPSSMAVKDRLIQTHSGMVLLYCTGGKLADFPIPVVYQTPHFNTNTGLSTHPLIPPPQ